jgi:flagellar biosynthesis regulator FlaF
MEDTSEILEIENNRIVVLKSNAEEKLSKEDYMCMQMLRQLDKEYPSRKRKKRIDVLKFTDEVWKSNLDDCRNKDYITEFYQKERHAARNYLIEDR